MSGQDRPAQENAGASVLSSKVDELLRDDTFKRLQKQSLANESKDQPQTSQNGLSKFLPDYMDRHPWDSPWGPVPGPLPRPPFEDRKKPGDPKPGEVPDRGGQKPAPEPLPELPKLPGTPDGGLSTKPDVESIASKVARESLVIGGGIGQSFFYGVANLPEHLPQIGTSVVLGGTLAAMSKTGKLGSAAAMVVGAYFVSRFVLDSVNDTRRWSKFADAVSDTWQSDANTWKNMHTVRDTLGNYTFDTSLSLASGYVGYKNPQLGQWILSLLRIPPITPGAPPPFNPRWTSGGMYMQIMPPAGFYRRYGDHTPFQDSGWRIDIHGEIRRVPDRITRVPGFRDYEPRHDHDQRRHFAPDFENSPDAKEGEKPETEGNHEHKRDHKQPDINPYDLSYRRRLQEEDWKKEHREKFHKR